MIYYQVKKQASEKCTQDSFQTTKCPEQPHPFCNRTVPRLLRSYHPWPRSSEGRHLWSLLESEGLCVLEILKYRKALK